MSYENAARQQLRRKWWLRAVGILACIVVFITVYALVLPAITMEKDTYCGLEEHTHTDDCYEVQLTCTNTDPDHEHSDACYTKTVICGLEEHIHSDDCYSPAEALAADQEDPVEAEETPDTDEVDDAEDVQDADTAAEALAAPAPVLRAPLLGAGATDGSIMDGRDVTGANDWQIVSEAYEGNDSSNKTVSVDGNVRIQKNVIPTDTENEFLVYLSIDTRNEKVVTETEITEYLYLDTTHYIAHTSNNYNHGYGNDYTGHYLPRDMSSSTTTWRPGSSGANKNIALRLWHDNEVVAVVQGYTDMSNGSFVLEMPGQTEPKHQVGLGIMTQAKVEVIDGVSMKVIDVPLQDDVYEDLIRVVTESSVAENSVNIAGSDHGVTDTLGDYMTDFELIYADGSAALGSDNKTIKWNITPKDNPKQETTSDSSTSGDSSTETTTTWNLNVAEMLYKVTLNVEKNGFNSAANNMSSTVSDKESYPVNDSAVLAYSVKKDMETVSGNAEFTNPYVRGLLYDVQGYKYDSEYNVPLAGAEFTLTGTNQYGTAVSLTESTNSDGVFLFDDGVAWGDYTVTESKAPDGYQALTDPVDISMCYTENTPGLTVNEVNGHMIFNGSDEVLRFENIKERAKVILVKVDENGAALPGAEFAIALTKPEGYTPTVDFVTVASTTSGDDGIYQTIENAPDGVYTVSERSAPDGYVLGDPFTFTVDGKSLTVSGGVTSSYDAETNTWTITMTNSPGAVLPATGGVGTVVFTVSGLTLMAAAMIFLIKQRKRIEV